MTRRASVAATLLVALLACGALAQDRPPTFKSSVYAIPMVVRVYERGGRKPKAGIKVEDVSLKVDGKPRAVARVDKMSDDKGPYFLVNFEPTDQDRDGRPHSIEISVKGIRKTMRATLTIPRQD